VRGERDTYHNHEELESDTGCPKHVHQASIINIYKQRTLAAPSIKFASGMHPSFRAAHRPLISFIGKRQWPPGSCRVIFAVFVFTQHGPGPQPQRPHPAAPAQLKETFSDFLKKYNSPSPSSGRNTQRSTFKDFWEAPTPLWRPRIRHLEDAEIDAVLVS
jgi:small subunit ribosomal protein YMR-31